MINHLSPGKLSQAFVDLLYGLLVNDVHDHVAFLPQAD